jgi:hypothetical protein
MSCLRPSAVSLYIFARRFVSEISHLELIQPFSSSRRNEGYNDPNSI